jgi:hypothetical protein
MLRAQAIPLGSEGERVEAKKEKDRHKHEQELKARAAIDVNRRTAAL